MITYEDFLLEAMGLGEVQDHPSYENNYKVKWYDLHGYGASKARAQRQAERDETPWDKKDGLYKKWQTGGVSGGNCWSDGGHYSLESEREPDWDVLEKLLDKHCPNLARKDYRALFDLEEKGEFTEREYYGNYTDYGWKWICARKLYDFLVERGALEGEV